MMGAMLTVTAKGQVTLKREVLEHLGVGPGDKLSVDVRPNGTMEVRPVRKGFDSFIGSLWRPDSPTLTIEEINEAARKGWAGER
ncbi:MAG: AbrB/MazE/SpoVT family DNA-binding domain-containing protein [Rhodospirillaceae bacterium]